MANECDTLGDFLKLSDEEKKTIKIGITGILPQDRKKAAEEAAAAASAATAVPSPVAPQLTNGVKTNSNTEVGAAC